MLVTKSFLSNLVPSVSLSPPGSRSGEKAPGNVVERLRQWPKERLPTWGGWEANISLNNSTQNCFKVVLRGIINRDTRTFKNTLTGSDFYSSTFPPWILYGAEDKLFEMPFCFFFFFFLAFFFFPFCFKDTSFSHMAYFFCPAIPLICPSMRQFFLTQQHARYTD